MSNSFENYTLRRAGYDDIDKIMAFIGKNWRPDHIMARDRAFFEYEFLEENGDVNCVLAIDNDTGEIEGNFMFLYTSNTEGYKDIWGSLFSVQKGNNAWLGLELMRQVPILSGCRKYISIGCNPKTSLKVAKLFFKRKSAKMNHYYRIANLKKDEFRIAKIEEVPVISDKSTNDEFRIEKVKDAKELHSFMDARDKECIPYKDFYYINKRFFNHPIYTYNVYKIMKQDEIKAFFVTRYQEYDGRIAIRMVDYVGEQQAFASTWDFWKEELAAEKVEYVDFYTFGFSEESLYNAGFTRRTDDDKNIIPNYFAPYVCQNIEIWTHFDDENILICKGDGDQDRPV